MTNHYFKIVLLLPFFAFSQAEKNPCETLLTINSYIQDNHYRPKAVDDSLSVYVFKKFLNGLDEDNRLFIQPEIDALKKYQYTLDDYIKTNDCDFLDSFYETYSKTILRYKNIIETIKKENFPMNSEEKVIFSKKAFPYVKDETELQHLYKKRILFNILREVAELSANKDSLVANLETLTQVSKKKVIDKYECKISNYEMSRNDFNSLFFTSFCSYFDPHTEYFSENEKSSFYSTVSSDNLSFGLYVSLSEKDEMSVEEIIPGSSAYFTHKINKGDQLLKIKHKKSEYEIACASMKKIDEIINSSDYKSADFTFRKKTGEIYTVHLVKKIIKDYQNNVFSYTIAKDSTSFGYIKIPSFYSTFENGKSNVSEDFIKEVFKQKRNNVDGIIIDLENNGGGSMEEAIKVSSLLIDNGPLAILNNRDNNNQIISDISPGSIYQGPIIILINGFSASASEFFVNAMQDYNRAIVIGNQSLGKASMQRIFPLKRDNSQFLKLTLEKFYRVSGQSNQYVGITPDVEIPSLFDKQMPREDSYKTALKNDTLGIKIPFNRIQNNIYTQAIEASKKRIHTNKDALEIMALNDKINPLYDNDLPPVKLQFDMVFNDVTKMNSLWKEIQSKNEKEYPITIENNTTAKEKNKEDDFSKSFAAEQIKEIKQNFHIVEALNILFDIKHY